MFKEKVKEGKEWKENFRSGETSQVKGFVGMLPLLLFSITAKGVTEGIPQTVEKFDYIVLLYLRFPQPGTFSLTPTSWQILLIF